MRSWSQVCVGHCNGMVIVRHNVAVSVVKTDDDDDKGASTSTVTDPLQVSGDISMDHV